MDEDLRNVLLSITGGVTVVLVAVIVGAVVHNLSAHYALERCIKAKEAGLNLEECKGE